MIKSRTIYRIFIVSLINISILKLKIILKMIEIFSCFYAINSISFWHNLKDEYFNVKNWLNKSLIHSKKDQHHNLFTIDSELKFHNEKIHLSLH
jgi:hypothetical protein